VALLVRHSLVYWCEASFIIEFECNPEVLLKVDIECGTRNTRIDPDVNPGVALALQVNRGVESHLHILLGGPTLSLMIGGCLVLEAWSTVSLVLGTPLTGRRTEGLGGQP
jgi:hypothetical protein